MSNDHVKQAQALADAYYRAYWAHQRAADQKKHARRALLNALTLAVTESEVRQQIIDALDKGLSISIKGGTA